MVDGKMRWSSGILERSERARVRSHAPRERMRVCELDVAQSGGWGARRLAFRALACARACVCVLLTSAHTHTHIGCVSVTLDGRRPTALQCLCVKMQHGTTQSKKRKKERSKTVNTHTRTCTYLLESYVVAEIHRRGESRYRMSSVERAQRINGKSLASPPPPLWLLMARTVRKYAMIISHSADASESQTWTTDRPTGRQNTDAINHCASNGGGEGGCSLAHTDVSVSTAVCKLPTNRPQPPPNRSARVPNAFIYAHTRTLSSHSRAKHARKLKPM